MGAASRLTHFTPRRLQASTQHLTADAAAAYRRGVMETLDAVDCDCHPSEDGCLRPSCCRGELEDLRRRLRAQAADGEVL